MAQPRRSAVVAVLLCALLLLAAPAGAQEVPTSTTSSTTSTTRPRLTTTSIERSEDGGRGRGLSTGNKVALLIGGLVVLALALTVFTWRYWRATKPARASVAAGKSPTV
jgi:hypothetical protein